jgi:cysteine desulfurase/selenocysteine lyase
MAGHADITHCRDDFPILKSLMNGKPLAYFDTASSAQKPQIVIDKMNDIMTHHYANIHRGLYHLSQVVTQEYESVRTKVAAFINASSANEIVFTRNTTEAINLVAQSWGRTFLKEGDEIILTEMDHHANIVPWHLLREQVGVVIKYVPLTAEGGLDYDAYLSLLSDKTKLVTVVHASNSLGTVNPVERMVKDAKACNSEIKVLIDASQSAVHGGIDVQDIGADFVTITGHKLYGPSGVGVLWGRYDVLESMPPYQGGGDMIESVSLAGSTFKAPPTRFEAGTPAIIEVIGLGAAIDYLTMIGPSNIVAHEKSLFDILMRDIQKIDGLTFYGTTQNKVGIASFTADWASGADIAMILDKYGVAVRAGHHCCMPLMNRLGVSGTVRASLGLYSNQNDINALVQGLQKAKEMLA